VTSGEGSHVNLQNRSRPGTAPVTQYSEAERPHDAAASQSAPGESSSLAQAFPRLARYRAAIIVGLALFFVWEIITRSLTAYLAYDNPELALALRHNQSNALVRLADRALNSDQKAQEQKGKESENVKQPEHADANPQQSQSDSVESNSTGGLFPN